MMMFPKLHFAIGVSINYSAVVASTGKGDANAKFYVKAFVAVGHHLHGVLGSDGGCQNFAGRINLARKAEDKMR